MWGVMSDSDDFPSDDRGLTPRVFESLFARIQEVSKLSVSTVSLLRAIIASVVNVCGVLLTVALVFQEEMINADKQLLYQCRCSFLEVPNLSFLRTVIFAKIAFN